MLRLGVSEAPGTDPEQAPAVTGDRAGEGSASWEHWQPWEHVASGVSSRTPFPAVEVSQGTVLIKASGPRSGREGPAGRGDLQRGQVAADEVVSQEGPGPGQGSQDLPRGREEAGKAVPGGRRSRRGVCRFCFR